MMGGEWEMIEFLMGYLQEDNTKLIYLLALILGANIIDFLLGFINARFNKEVKFNSSKAIYGIVRKLIMFIVLIYFIPVALLVPPPIGLGAIYVLFTGYLLSELNSILSHLKLADDGKEKVFAEFISKIFQKKDVS